jgi:hypothetical protein
MTDADLPGNDSVREGMNKRGGNIFGKDDV